MVTAPSDRALLDAWEEGHPYSLLGKCLLLLDRASPDADLADLMALPIGERDARLLQLRRLLFGPRLSNVAPCPACGDRLEWDMDLDDLLLRPPAPIENGKVFHLERDGQTLAFRLPTSEDVVAALDQQQRDPADELFARCFQPATDKVALASPPNGLRTAVLQAMAEQDPQADLQIGLQCPACDHTWTLTFDVLRYLWKEIHDWAMRTLQDIALLASRFGWTEGEILSLSRYRRDLYKSMILG